MRKSNVNSIESFLNFMAKITKTFLPKANKKKSVLFFFLLTGLTIVGREKKKPPRA